MKEIFFITGVNGVGKTSIIKYLKNTLDPHFEVHDFDERGVPNNAGRDWRLEETKHWITLGKENGKQNISTIICGFARPSEISDESVGFILLDANEETIKQRLWSRYQTTESIQIIEKVVNKPVQRFIDDNILFSKVMREEATKYGVKIIDTTQLTPEQVAKNIVDYLNSDK
jgi:2-phosphoglycerate kinase